MARQRTRWERTKTTGDTLLTVVGGAALHEMFGWAWLPWVLIVWVALELLIFTLDNFAGWLDARERRSGP